MAEAVRPHLARGGGVFRAMLTAALLLGPGVGGAIPLDRIDLGPVPETGDAAAATIDARTDLVIVATACGREHEFWNAVEQPGKEPPERFQGDPYPALIAKVAFLVRHQGADCVTTVPYGDRDPANALPFSEPFQGARWEEPLDPVGRTRSSKGSTRYSRTVSARRAMRLSVTSCRLRLRISRRCSHLP